MNHLGVGALFLPHLNKGAAPVVDPPVADFTVDVLFGTVSFTATFTDLSTNDPTSWDWDFGDGSAHATTQNPAHEYTVAGVYTVTLIATNSGGSDTETKTGYISAYREVTLTLQPAVDAYVRSDQAATNFGTSDNVNVGRTTGPIYHTLIKPNLSSIPAGVIISSTILSLYPYTPSRSGTQNRTFAVYRQKRAWAEAEVTWNIYSTGNNWQTAGGFGADDCEQTDIGSRDFTTTESTAEFKDFTLTGAAVADLDLGNGWMIKSTLEDSLEWYFCSSDHATEAQRPKLVVVYKTTTPA